MLVLSRKETQRIVLPSLGITVEVLEIRGGRVRIGIEAPTEIPVYRQEIAQNPGGYASFEKGHCPGGSESRVLEAVL